MNRKQEIARKPVIGPVAIFAHRTKMALNYYRTPMLNLFRWLFKSKETTNLTYNLDRDNQRYLASLIAHVTGSSYSLIAGYIAEAEADDALRRHISHTTSQSPLGAVADRDVKFGRRLGWYAFVRVMKPKVVIETGVDKGLGACLLAAALMRNKEEGYDGKYYGTDINPEAGYLLTGRYAEFGRILYGDSIESLSAIDDPIDLFINDSDHAADYEAAGYETVAGKLSAGAVILGDNCHVTDKLLNFSLKHGREFIFFGEKPADHWYPGAGIGISFDRAS